VNEIAPDGTVVHLSSLLQPKKTGVGDIGGDPMAANMTSFEIKMHLIAYVGVDIAAKMMSFMKTSGPSFKEITAPIGDKERRAEIRGFIKTQMKKTFKTEVAFECIKIVKETEEIVRSQGTAAVIIIITKAARRTIDDVNWQGRPYCHFTLYKENMTTHSAIVKLSSAIE